MANLAALEAALAQRFLGLRESNPELTASHPMIAVMNALMRLENEIALMRKGYNDAAEAYNTRLQRLPDRLFAWLGGFREMAYIT